MSTPFNTSKIAPSKHHPNRAPYNELVYKDIDRQLNKLRGMIKGDLYDLGSGSSPYKSWLQQYCNTYTAVDWKNSIHQGNVDIEANLSEKLPIPNSVADTIFCISVLEHLPEPQTFLAECSRISKDNSFLILQVPFMWRIHEAPNDYYRFTSYGLKYLLEKAGYTDVRVIPELGFFSMIVLKTNYQTLRLIRGPQPLQALLKSVLNVYWYLGCQFATFLDSIWPNETEVFGYFATAIKK